jgi:hypothetical protein
MMRLEQPLAGQDYAQDPNDQDSDYGTEVIDKLVALKNRKPAPTEEVDISA